MTDPTRHHATPYELVFERPEFDARAFPAIRGEAERVGADPLKREEFSFLAAVAEAIGAMAPEEVGSEELEQHRALLYHAFNFWRYGRRVYAVDTAVARFLVEAAPALDDWELTVPHASVYLQLPPRLFWGSIAPGTPPEPIDGFFLCVSEDLDALDVPFQQLEILMILGVRADRAGFSVIAFETEVGEGIGDIWAEQARGPDAKEYENVLPGGELSGLYSIVTAPEAIKLAGRILWFIDRHREGLVKVEPASDPEAEPERGPAIPPPRLPYTRVTLGDAAPAG